MRISAGWGAALAALFPLPLAIAIGSTSFSAVGADIPFAIAVLALALSLFAFSFRRSKPQYRVGRGAGAWAGVATLGVSLFLAGSFLGEHMLQWEAAALVYFGSLAYLGGRRLATSLLPSLAAVAVLLPLQQFFSGIWLDGVLVALACMAAVAALATVRLGVSEQRACEHCTEYELQRRGFCDYCGRRLAQPFEVEVPGRRLGAAIAFSLVFVLLLGVSLPVLSLSGTGLHVAEYGLAGQSNYLSLPAAPGWTRSLTGHTSTPNGTTFAYLLTDGPTRMNATLSLSTSSVDAAAGAIAAYPGAAPDGFTMLPDGTNATQFVLEHDGLTYNGLLVGANAYYLLVGEANQAHAYYFYVWPASTPRPVVADGVMQVVGLSSAELQRAGEAGSIVVSLFSLVQTNELIVLAACAIALLAAIGAVAASADGSRSKDLDNSLGLSGDELALLTSMDANRLTGRAIVGGSACNWDKLAPALYRLEELGLLRRDVVAVRGTPRMLWRSGAS